MMNTKFRTAFLKLLLCLLPCLVAAALVAQDQGVAQVQENGNPPSVAARISSLQGNVSFEPSGQNQWSQATLNYALTAGDRIYTDHGASAELEIGRLTVRIGEATDVI